MQDGLADLCERKEKKDDWEREDVAEGIPGNYCDHVLTDCDVAATVTLKVEVTAIRGAGATEFDDVASLVEECGREASVNNLTENATILGIRTRGSV